MTNCLTLARQMLLFKSNFRVRGAGVRCAGESMRNL